MALAAFQLAAAQILQAHQVDFPFWTSYWPPAPERRSLESMLQGRTLAVSGVPHAAAARPHADKQRSSQARQPAWAATRCPRPAAERLPHASPPPYLPASSPRPQLRLDAGGQLRVDGFHKSDQLALSRSDLRAGASVVHVLSLEQGWRGPQG